MASTPETPQAEPTGDGRRKQGGLLRLLVILALAAWAFRSLVAAPFYIPSGSMLPTLFVGDYLFVAKWPYGYSRYSFPWGFPSFDGRLLAKLPKRGDIVVFRPPGGETEFIKRVIGLPGDMIAVRSGMLVINGQAVPRQALRPFALPVSANSPCAVVPPAQAFTTTAGGQTYCLYPAYRETLPGGASFAVLDQVDSPQVDHFGPVKVPQGHIFVMGDNRDSSADSRVSVHEHGVGMLPVDNLVGRALVTFWSTDGSASYAKPWTWFSALRSDRVGNSFRGTPE